MRNRGQRTVHKHYLLRYVILKKTRILLTFTAFYDVIPVTFEQAGMRQRRPARQKVCPVSVVGAPRARARQNERLAGDRPTQNFA